MVTRTIYRKRWTCFEPGRWRSECGWYEVVRVDGSRWIGIDLSEPKKKEAWSTTMNGAIWQLVKEEWVREGFS